MLDSHRRRSAAPGPGAEGRGHGPGGQGRGRGHFPTFQARLQRKCVPGSKVKRDKGRVDYEYFSDCHITIRLCAYTHDTHKTE